MTVYIYKLTNLINGLIYIGITQNIDDRFKAHQRLGESKISQAIHEFGWDNFKKEIIDQYETEEEAIIKESEYILTFDCRYPKGYNQILLWEGKLDFTDEHKEKLSKSSQGKRTKKLTSEYIGVVKTQGIHRSIFRASVRVNRKVCGKNFQSEIEAAEAYDKMYLYMYGIGAILNFPQKTEEYLKNDLKEFYNWFVEKSQRRYFGVSIYKKNPKFWRARVNSRKTTDFESDSFCLGFYNSEEEAAEARDKAVLFFKIKTRLNFPDKLQEYLNSNLQEFIEDIQDKQKSHSKYDGVCREHKGPKWRAYCYSNGKQINIGLFSTENDAFAARKDYLHNHPEIKIQKVRRKTA